MVSPRLTCPVGPRDGPFTQAVWISEDGLKRLTVAKPDGAI
jgi:hypothetical protein